jgi:hypothetical protein
MKDVSRYALVVRYTQNLLDWVNTIFPDNPISMDFDGDDEATVYLIPEFMDIEEARAWLRKHFKSVLEQELEDWCTDSALWPPLTWKTFESFLDCRIHGVVLDASALGGQRKKPDGRGSAKSAGKKMPVDPYALEIEISLNDSQPKIWRRVHIDPDTTFVELHYIIQFAMGWTNSHLHHFIIAQGKTYISIPFLNELDGDIQYVDSTITRVGDYLKEPNDHFTYEYDFGDSWNHTITLIKHIPRLPNITLPVVIDGTRACPPEDCGGIWGYQDILKALKQPRSKEGKLYANWRETGLDPERFDLVETNDQYFKRFKRVMAEWERYANS